MIISAVLVFCSSFVFRLYSWIVQYPAVQTIIGAVAGIRVVVFQIISGTKRNPSAGRATKSNQVLIAL